MLRIVVGFHLASIVAEFGSAPDGPALAPIGPDRRPAPEIHAFSRNRVAGTPAGGYTMEGLRSMHRTLVVDDSPTIRRMVIASLRDVCTGGFSEAASGLEAIEQLALGPVGLMVLDLNMPDMHGLEVLKFVRSHQAFSGIPIIVLTTRGDDASRAAADGRRRVALPDQALRAAGVRRTRRARC